MSSYLTLVKMNCEQLTRFSSNFLIYLLWLLKYCQFLKFSFEAHDPLLMLLTDVPRIFCVYGHHLGITLQELHYLTSSLMTVVLDSRKYRHKNFLRKDVSM